MYWGEMGVDFWDAAIWKHQIDTHEVLVMTPQILLNALRHSFFKLEFIKVLILDECHHTSGKHPYACIMKEFYHPMLISNSCDIPRIFGMTASLIKSKCRISELDYWDKIKELETIMHSKVYTCVSESVISEYVPIPTAEFRFYDDVDVPSDIYGRITTELNMLKTKHESSLGHLDLTESSLESTRKKLSRTHYTLLYCLYDLGLWLAYKAATFMSSSECVMLWDKLDASGERSVKKFSLDASKAFENCISAELTIGGDAMRDENNAFISTKVYSLLQSLLDRSGDISTQSRLEKYLSSGEIMRSESLRHASTPCSPLGSELSDEEETYRVESTGAVVTSAYSIELIYFYCSRLPSDGYFKPAPLCVFDKETGSCTLYLPKSCPLPPVCVEGDIKSLKQKVCLEACIQLHKIGALTDNLVPDTVAEKLLDPELGEECYDDDHPVYFPPDFVRNRQLGSNAYYCYLIKLSPQFDSEIHVQDIFLVICNELETDVISSDFSLQTDRGTVAVTLSFIGHLDLKPMEVERCRRFQMTILNVLINHTWDKLKGNSQVMKQSDHLDYFLLPAVASAKNPTIDWRCVSSVLFSYNQSMEDHKNCMFLGNARYIETKDGPACKCMLQNSLVYTPHNQKLYCIWGVSDELTGNSILSMRDGESLTYKDYYKKRHGLKLCLNEQSLLSARQVFPVLNLLLRCKQKIKEKESRNAYVDLPPELCSIVMSPISISTFYSFTFVPSIMHRLESLLVAFNLKKMHLDSMHNVVIPSEKVLEAITTKTCQEKIHLESLETLGDSFLKYTACQHLFRAYQNHHEGLLSIKKDRIVSNASLFSLGYNIKLPGFIRDAPFDPKTWMIPGSKAVDYSLSEELLPNAKKIFIRGTRKMKRKKVADVVEALIGAYLSVGGETATLLFMNWIGIRIDFTGSPSPFWSKL
ncbi:Endoribonuclease Dicer homolog 2 [Linum perenne]